MSGDCALQKSPLSKDSCDIPTDNSRRCRQNPRRHNDIGTEVSPYRNSKSRGIAQVYSETALTECQRKPQDVSFTWEKLPYVNRFWVGLQRRNKLKKVVAGRWKKEKQVKESDYFFMKIYEQRKSHGLSLKFGWMTVKFTLFTSWWQVAAAFPVTEGWRPS